MGFSDTARRACAAMTLLVLSSTAMPVCAQDQSHTWSGAYVGGGIGARWANVDWTTSSIYAPMAYPGDGFASPLVGRDAQLNSAGFRGSIFTGYNWQSSNWVWGVEADLGIAKSKGTVIGTPGVNYFNNVPGDRLSVEAGLDGSIRARGGALILPSLLLYGTAGLALQQTTLRSSCGPQVSATFCNWGAGLGELSESTTKILPGWTLGAGIEGALSKNWIVRAEYRYADFGTVKQHFFSGNPQLQWTGTAPIQTQTLNVGLSYKF